MTVRQLPDLNTLKRILIIRLSSIGDVVHALPVAAALKDAYPHLELTWIVEEMSAPIVTGSPCLASVIVVPRNRWKKQGRWTSPTVWREYFALLRTVRAARFDMALDMQGYAKSALIALASGARYRYGWQNMRDGSAYVSPPLPSRASSKHRVDKFLDVPAAFGAEAAPVRFPMHVPEDARESVCTALASNGILTPGVGYAVINPASGSATRRWSEQQYCELSCGLAVRFGLSIVLVGTARDCEINARITGCVAASEAFATTGLKIADLCGETDIKQLAAVLEGCAVHVCGDTGSAHIAAALGRPVVALYGPTDPTYAGPWNQSANVLAHREHCIEGCGVRQCALVAAEGGGGTARCLSAITPDEVLSRVGKVLNAQ